ncbi:hypothetical protein [uncultured Parasphingopyxis sp.]|uniref:hypothetical protein n=1 Tax=uncultured Parasphingopyxis sp. TaxID=1547918 RepID=UPI00261CD303|nr:hypothetical protein [uncultured Parasphingopyxis sp.]
MKRKQFGELFTRAISNAITAAGLDESLFADEVELHLEGRHNLDVQTAISRLFLADDRFFKIIDVSVHPRRSNQIFVGVSGHEPGPWSETYAPDELGPYKVMAVA